MTLNDPGKVTERATISSGIPADGPEATPRRLPERRQPLFAPAGRRDCRTQLTRAGSREATDRKGRLPDAGDLFPGGAGEVPGAGGDGAARRGDWACIWSMWRSRWSRSHCWSLEARSRCRCKRPGVSWLSHPDPHAACAGPSAPAPRAHQWFTWTTSSKGRRTRGRALTSPYSRASTASWPSRAIPIGT